MTLTIGADPEIFFENRHGKLISAADKLPGTKYAPYPDGDGYFTHPDNVAAEFGFTPSSSYVDFNNKVHTGLSIVNRKAKEHKLRMSKKASGSFAAEELQHPAASEFGCEPDYNAWTGEVNESPRAEDSSFRSCGGHVHVGFIEDYPDLNPLRVVRAMDLWLGVPSVFLDKDKDRRKLYGKAGAFRPKDYGAEYRVLSNFWIWTPILRYWVYLSVRNAVNWALERNIESDSTLAELIKYSINNSDVDAANAVIKEVPLIAPNDLIRR